MMNFLAHIASLFLESMLRQSFVTSLGMERETGLRLNTIIVSEGSIDREGNPIIVEAVKKVVVDRLVMIKTIM